MTMLNKLLTLLFIITLGACSSEPVNKSFVGTGDFNAAEAAKTRVSLGLTYLKNGNFSQAKFNLDKALEFAPRSGEAHYATAFYYQQVEEYERAEQYYQSAIGYSRNDPDVLNSYGAFLCKQGDYSKAKTYFLKAVDDKRYISTASTYENLALCAQNQGLTDEATEYFISALNHQPTRPSTLFYLTQNYIIAKDWSAAKKSLWKYERNSSVNADSLWMSYQIALGENNLKAAVEYSDILKKLYPDHKNTKMTLLELGKFQPVMSVKQKQKEEVTPAPSVPVITESVIVEPVLIDTSPPNSVELQTQAGRLEDMATGLEAEAATEAALAAQFAADSAENKKQPEFHIVLPKENLYRISLKYNVKMKKLLKWNNLTDASSLPMGTKLRVRDPNTNEQ